MVVDDQLLKLTSMTQVTLSTMTNIHVVVNNDKDSARPCPPPLTVMRRRMKLSNRINLPSFHRLFETLCRLPLTTTGQTPPAQGGGGVINSLHQSVHLNWGETGNSLGIRVNIVSPPDGDSDEAREQHKGVVRAIFNQELNLHVIPSQHICPLMQELPLWLCISTYPTETGTPLIRFLSGLNFTGRLPLWEI